MKKSAIKFGCTFLFTLTFDYYTEDAVCDASKVEYCFLLASKKILNSFYARLYIFLNSLQIRSTLFSKGL